MQASDRAELIDRIREKAYTIWQSEGCPDGRAEQHWAAAEQELDPALTAPDRGTGDAPHPAASGTDQQDAPPPAKRRRA